MSEKMKSYNGNVSLLFLQFENTIFKLGFSKFKGYTMKNKKC